MTRNTLEIGGRLALALSAVCLGLTIYHWSDSISAVSGKDIATHPDEAAHFVTGVMALDYVRDGLGSNPVQFAQSYYARYPKVAIGHWPPMFYAVEGTWMAIFGAKAGSVRALVLLIGLAWLSLFVFWTKGEFGLALSLIGVAVLGELRVVQATSILVLSDGLVTFLTLGAACFWLRFVDSDRWGDALRFALLAAAAVLTKGNAWVMGLAIAAAPLFMRRGSLYFRKSYWVSGALIVMLGAPFFIYAQRLQAGYPIGTIASGGAVAESISRLPLLFNMHFVLPLLGWALLLVGAGAGWKKAASAWAFSVAMVFGMALFLLVSGLSFEDRVIVPALPFAGYLMLVGARAIGNAVPRASALAGCAILAVVWMLIPYTGQGTRDGYGHFARLVPPGPYSVLVASDAIGEGAVVSDRLMQDRKREGVVLRASKLLSEQNWNGQGYRELQPDTNKLSEMLDTLPVHYVLVDEGRMAAHSKRVLEVAQSRMRSVERGYIDGNAVTLFENLSAKGKPLKTLQFSLGPWHGNRVVKLTRP